MKTEQATHTPGPWHTERVEGEGGLVYVRIGSAHSVAYSGVYGPNPKGGGPKLSDGECEANARLIAASPALLGCLRSAVEIMATLHDDGDLSLYDLQCLERAQAAIAATEPPA